MALGRQLQGYLPPERSVGTPRQPNLGHTPNTQASNQLIGAYARTGLNVSRLTGAHLVFESRQSIECPDRRGLRFVRQQHATQRRSKILVFGRKPLEPSAAPSGIQ